jgi:hypothetical protein
MERRPRERRRLACNEREARNMHTLFAPAALTAGEPPALPRPALHCALPRLSVIPLLLLSALTDFH